MEAHRILSVEYQQLEQEQRALAGRHHSLQSEMNDMQTEALAHEAVMRNYEYRLANQRLPDKDRMHLVEEKVDMHIALAHIGELLAVVSQDAASRKS